MVLIVFISLLILCILFCCANNSKITINHIIIILLNIFQFKSVSTFLSSFPDIDFFSYPISFWIGFYWASLLSVVISFYTFIIENKKKGTDNKEN